MGLLKKIGLVLAAAAALSASAFVLLVGPWPVYRNAGHQSTAYFREAVAGVDSAAAQSGNGRAAGTLTAGWAERDITPEPGHPMAGYGSRPNDKRSTGVHERLFVRAAAVGDGVDTVVLVGSDMLQTLPNLLEMVEPVVARETGLTNANIMYTSSHTHSGPGGLAPGFAAEASYGPHDPAYVARLAEAFSGAIVEAVRGMAPARIAHGALDVPEFIRNRSRKDGAVDSTLHFAVLERADGARLNLARYSAHGTAFGEEMLEFNNDWCGAFQRHVGERTGAPLLFMGGAVGSMRPFPPGPPPVPEPATRDQEMGFENDVESALVRDGRKTVEQLVADQAARMDNMGRALAERFAAAAAAAVFTDTADVASAQVFFDPPPAQVRLVSKHWRLSPFLFHLLGVPPRGRMQAARVGDLFLIGMPHDFGGEVSRDWQAWAAERGMRLWVTSFSGAYLGYLSPDRFHWDIGEQYSYNQNYELGQMGWFGPNQEAYVTDLFQRLFAGMTPAPPAAG